MQKSCAKRRKLNTALKFASCTSSTPSEHDARRRLAALCLPGLVCGFITPTRHAVKPSFDPCAFHKKESTWDRLTGPKLFKTVKRTEGIHAVPLVPLRVIAGILMIHHGSEGGFWPANYGTPGFDGFVTYVLQPYFSFCLEAWRRGARSMIKWSSGAARSSRSVS